MSSDPNTQPPTTPHRATPEQWRHVDSYDLHWLESTDSCLLEIRDTLALTREALAALERRVGALEEPPYISVRPNELPPFPTPIAPPEALGPAPAPAAAPAPPAACAAYLQSEIDVIESCAGFCDESTPVGEAWARVLGVLSRVPYAPPAVPQALEVLGRIAEVAHAGGLIGFSQQHAALNEIRRLTQPFIGDRLNALQREAGR